MIKLIDFETIEKIWNNHLWPNRTSPIKTHSAMMHLGGYDMGNYNLPVFFIGYYDNNKLIGTNSYHYCTDNSLRIRGLWVHNDFRKQGIASNLIKYVIDHKDQSGYIWAYPRRTSLNIFNSLGFVQTSDWQVSETSEANAYCSLG
jgi:N-acetylglutamate synthase-like GNAT family acetyltransferase